ncbi:MAG: cupin domain-containing protein [Epsilonproteobacteria bacterium]|nr:cupin domain-containing protein [Campylobacterota bacterium]
MEIEQEYIEQVNEMVSYQEDAIVSKIITDKQTGRITMFAFSKNQGISEQSLPFDSVLFITDGKVELVMNDETTILEKDNVVLIPRNTSHEIFGIENFKMLSIIIGDKDD